MHNIQYQVQYVSDTTATRYMCRHFVTPMEASNVNNGNKCNKKGWTKANVIKKLSKYCLQFKLNVSVFHNLPPLATTA